MAPFYVVQHKKILLENPVYKQIINAGSNIMLNDGVSTIILTDSNGDPVINEFFKGLQQGREQGIAENQLAIIKNTLNMDMNDDTIQTVTGCTAEYLASVKKSMVN